MDSPERIESSSGRAGRKLIGGAILLVCLTVAWQLINRDDGAGTPRTPVIALDLIVLPTGDADEMQLQRRVRCAGGREPAQCKLLRRLGGPESLRVRDGGVCAQQHAGAAIAQVRGLWDGEEVDERLTLTDSCQIARWKRLQRALRLPLI